MFLIRSALGESKDEGSRFLMYSLIALIGISISFYLGGMSPTSDGPKYGMPIIAFFAAYLLVNVMHKLRYRSVKVVIYIALAFVVVMSFLAPWSHRYFANFLYDPSLRPTDVGMHNPKCLSVAPFIRNYVNVGDGIVFSDDSVAPFLVLSPEDYTSVRYYGSERSILGRSNSFVFEFIHFNAEFSESFSIPRTTVEMTYNKVLDGGIYAIYYKE
jgi:hypothetical protein